MGVKKSLTTNQFRIKEIIISFCRYYLKVERYKKVEKIGKQGFSIIFQNIIFSS